MKRILNYFLVFFFGCFPLIVQAGDFVRLTNFNRSFTSLSFYPSCNSPTPDFTCQGKIGLVHINGHDYSERNILNRCTLGSLDHQHAGAYEENVMNVDFYNAQCSFQTSSFRIYPSSYTSESQALQDCAQRSLGSCEFIWKDNSGKYFIIGDGFMGGSIGSIITGLVTSGLQAGQDDEVAAPSEPNVYGSGRF